MAKNKKAFIRKLCVTAALTALIFIMAFTPLGYLKLGVVSITFLPIPVVIGAILGGPCVGAFLGGMFGVTSFIQCFGMDAFGTTLFSISPLFTVILCIIPRIMMGLLPALIYKGLSKTKFNSVLTYGITSVSGGIINTILFVGVLILLFGNSEYLRSFGNSLPAILSVLVTFNAVIEWVVCLLVGTAISKALTAAFKEL